MDLLIDGNAFLNIAMSVINNMIRTDRSFDGKYYVEDIFNDRVQLKEAVKIRFRGFCFTYLSSMVTPLGSSLGGVHFVMDSNSWRKEYIREYFKKESDTRTGSAIIEFEYKNGRKKDQYQYLFFDYFKDHVLPGLVNRCGMDFYRCTGAEGDDIISHICEKLNADIMIFSVDKDIKQLVGTPGKNVLLIMPKQMSKHKKIFVPKYYLPQPEIEVEDFFDLSESTMNGGRNQLESIITEFEKKDYVQYEVDAEVEVLDKILSGDSSDKIPRLNKLTAAKAKRAMEDILVEFGGEDLLGMLDRFEPRLLEFILDRVCHETKVTDQNMRDDLRDHLIFNIRVTRLATKVFPVELQEALTSIFDKTKEHYFDTRQYNSYKKDQVHI